MFKDKIYNPVRQRCDVFFDSDYHSLINLTSFGHDIETAWLMDRTCEIISDKSYQQILTQITDTLTTAVYNSAYDFENHGLFNEKENNSTDQQKIWWVQAESVVGFYNAYQKHLHGTILYRLPLREGVYSWFCQPSLRFQKAYHFQSV